MANSALCYCSYLPFCDFKTRFVTSILTGRMRRVHFHERLPFPCLRNQVFMRNSTWIVPCIFCISAKILCKRHCSWPSPLAVGVLRRFGPVNGTIRLLAHQAGANRPSGRGGSPQFHLLLCSLVSLSLNRDVSIFLYFRVSFWVKLDLWCVKTTHVLLFPFYLFPFV